MPCFPRKQRKFEVIRDKVRQAQKENNFNFNTREEVRRDSETLYSEIRQKLDDHIKALERLKTRLRRATSEHERQQLEKEIAELEEEISKYEDMLQELLDFIRDLERRVISITEKKE